jgi:hypothetical protein
MCTVTTGLYIVGKSVIFRKIIVREVRVRNLFKNMRDFEFENNLKNMS